MPCRAVKAVFSSLPSPAVLLLRPQPGVGPEEPHCALRRHAPGTWGRGPASPSAAPAAPGLPIGASAPEGGCLGWPSSSPGISGRGSPEEQPGSVCASTKPWPPRPALGPLVALGPFPSVNHPKPLHLHQGWGWRRICPLLNNNPQLLVGGFIP